MFDQVTAHAVAASSFTMYNYLHLLLPRERELIDRQAVARAYAMPGVSKHLNWGTKYFDPGYEYFRDGYSIQRLVSDFETGFRNFSQGRNIWRWASNICNRGMNILKWASKILQQMAPFVVVAKSFCSTVYLTYFFLPEMLK